MTGGVQGQHPAFLVNHLVHFAGILQPGLVQERQNRSSEAIVVLVDLHFEAQRPLIDV